MFCLPLLAREVILNEIFREASSDLLPLGSGTLTLACALAHRALASRPGAPFLGRGAQQGTWVPAPVPPQDLARAHCPMAVPQM